MHSFLNEDTVRRIAGWCALISLVFAIGMAFEYGRAMSYLHAGILGLLAIAVPVAFVGSDMMRASGRKTAATVLLAAGCALSIGEFCTHFGYTVGTREEDSQQTGVQNATYEAVQQNRASEATNLELWRKQLADLKAANDKIGASNPDGLRAEISVKDEAIRQEERRGGCGPICLKLKQEKAAVEWQLGTVVKSEELEKRIAATQRVLDSKVETAAKTEFHSSKIVNQARGFAQIAMWTDTPSISSINWVQLVLGGLIAFITTYLTLVFTTVAFSTRKPNPPPVGDLGNRKPETRAYPLTHAGMPSEPLHIHTTEQIKDPIIRRWSLSEEVQSLLGGQELKAA